MNIACRGCSAVRLDLLAEHNEREQKGRKEDLHWTATVNL
jgi:hypothetical protein